MLVSILHHTLSIMDHTILRCWYVVFYSKPYHTISIWDYIFLFLYSLLLLTYIMWLWFQQRKQKTILYERLFLTNKCITHIHVYICIWYLQIVFLGKIIIFKNLGENNKLYHVMNRNIFTWIPFFELKH